MQLSMFLLEEPLANHSASRDCEKGLKTLAETSCLLTLQSLNVTGLNGLSGKTSPASCHQTEDGILEPSLGRWGNWGMGGPTESWTLNGSEWPSALRDAVSSIDARAGMEFEMIVPGVGGADEDGEPPIVTGKQIGRAHV